MCIAKMVDHVMKTKYAIRIMKKGNNLAEFTGLSEKRNFNFKKKYQSFGMKFTNNLFVVLFIYLASSLDITTAKSRNSGRHYNNSGRGNCIHRGGEFYTQKLVSSLIPRNFSIQKFVEYKIQKRFTLEISKNQR